MRNLIAYSADAKKCAQQIVLEAFNDILCGDFDIPSQGQMENFLKDVIEYSFDEYKVKNEIRSSHKYWEKEQVNNEVYRLKMKSEKKYRDDLIQAASEAITEIESLISSLNENIKKWKIKNLEQVLLY